MGFIGDLFSGDKGAGFQAQGVPIQDGITDDQLKQGYDQSQQGLAQQQAFLNALRGQNGIGNQAAVFNQQQGLANQLQNQAMGGGPNPALQQLQNVTGQNVANQAALMAGQRGASANPGLMAELAARQGGQIQQQANGQAALQAAQQQLAAQHMLQQQQGLMAGTAGQQVGQQSGALNQYNNAAQNMYGIGQGALAHQNAEKVGMQSNMNSANAAIASGNQKSQAGLIGGLLGSAGSALIPIPKAHGGMIGHYDDGGEVDGEPKSFAGKFFNNMKNGMNSMSDDDNPMYRGASQLGKGIGGVASKYLSGGDSSSVPGFSMPEIGSSFASTAPSLIPSLALRGGGKVPGQAKIKGDSLKNDTVPIMASPGEVVIPRSIMNSKNPPKKAAEFVAAVLAKKSRGKK